MKLFDTDSLDDLLTTEEAAELLRTSPRTLQDWRAQRTGPRFARLNGGSKVVYRRRDLIEWIEALFAAWDEWQAS